MPGSGSRRRLPGYPVPFADPQIIRPHYLDLYRNHFHGKGYVTGQGATNTTLDGAVSEGASSITLVSATGFLVGEVIVLGSAPTFQTVVIDSVVTNTLTISPAIQPGGFGNGSSVTHGWSNDTHPGYSLSYAAFSQAVCDARRLSDTSRYVIEDPGAGYVAWVGDSWGSGANGVADHFRTALETRLGRSVNYLNASVSGNRLDQMLNRFDADVAPYRPRYVVFEYGANDLVAGRSQAFMEADSDLAVTKCRAIGATPVFPGIPPIASVIATAEARNDQIKARVESY